MPQIPYWLEQVPSPACGGRLGRGQLVVALYLSLPSKTDPSRPPPPPQHLPFPPINNIIRTVAASLTLPTLNTSPPQEKNMDWNTIDTTIQNKSLLKHEFYTAWSAGNLTVQDLQFYAKQYYALETTFPRLLSRIHSSCDNPSIRQMILENLNEEELGKENHRELWLRFAEGVGCNRDEVMSAPLNQETIQCIRTLMNLAAHSNPAVGLSMLYAYESQLPEISQSKIDGLKRFYGIDDPQTLSFFEVHKEADTWHAAQEKVMLEELGASDQEVKQATETACAALWSFLDGVNAERLVRNGITSEEACCH